MEESEVEVLIRELADLAQETVKAAADHKVTLDELLELGDDTVDVVNAIKALVDSDPEKRAARKAKRATRKAARRARRAARQVDRQQEDRAAAE